jgi:hypothetical protein
MPPPPVSSMFLPEVGKKSGLHGVISRIIENLIVIVVRLADATENNML